MSGAAADEARGPTPPSAADAALAPAGPSDASFAEQNLSFTTTDLSLVEMTEIEYTQLQHILCSHMEAAGGEGEGEPRLNAAFVPTSSSTEPAPDACPAAAATQPVFPVLCQPAESSLLSSNPCVGHVDFQELRMLLLSEPNAAHADKTPSGGSAEAPARAKGSGGRRESAGADGPVPEARAKSAVRVRLEDRFNSIPAEPPPRAPEPHEPPAALNNLVTLIRPPSELLPLHQHPSKCGGLVKNKAAALPFPYPLLAVNAAAGASSAQTSGTSCTILEAAKHQDLGLPRTFCYHQEMEATKQTAGARSKALPEQVWIKVGDDALCKQALSKRSRGRPSPLAPGAERRPLGEIQNTREGPAAAQGAWPAAPAAPGAPAATAAAPAATAATAAAPAPALEGVSQRRERHNRMERDRRRRIRICCDELNLLVPFCTADTDKATTLQWTTAFLKYIHERHGDSLKKEFETVFCGKTGRRLKLARSDSFVACPAQENTPGLGDQVA